MQSDPHITIVQSSVCATVSSIQILLLIAGNNDPSNAATLAAAFGEGAKKAGAQIEAIFLKDMDLEHFSLKFYEPKTHQGKDFENLKKALLAADGVLIATPVWNFSVPAHLKNAIDRMGEFALDSETHTRGQLKGKPFYFLFTGGAPTPVWKGITRFTTMHLPESIRYFGGAVAGRFYEGKCTIDKATFGLVVDKRPDVLARAQAKGEKFGNFVRRFKETGTLPLYYRVLSWSYEKGKRFISKF